MSFPIRRASFARNAGLCSGLLILGLGQSMANTLCVNPGGTAGCYSTIGAAVKAAAAGDTVNVASGEYAEGVIVNKQLSLVGVGAHSTIINAHGQPNGIYLDGLDNAGLANVLVTGFTVINANFEGILVTNTTNSLLTNNHVTGNDQSLNYTTGTCAGLPIFETNEGLDCGEGIHLVGAFAVTVTNNEVDLNSGGILLSDETGKLSKTSLLRILSTIIPSTAASPLHRTRLLRRPHPSRPMAWSITTSLVITLPITG